MFVFVLFLIVSVSARDLTDDEYYRLDLPELYHLDNYEECLAHNDGLYCLGVLHAVPGEVKNDVYDMLKEYSEEIYTFNRTLFHRGYCITSRCPELNSTLNFTSRFTNCAAKLDENNLNLELVQLHYCHTRSDVIRQEVPDVWQLLFLSFICVLVLINIVGTLYDFRTRDNAKKIQTLMAWSAISNWQTLTKSESLNSGRTSPLTALHGIRVCIAIGTCLSHSALIYYTMYLNNPRVLERIIRHPLSMFIQNSTAMEQMFIVISGFLYAYQLRQLSQKQPVSYKAIPMFIAKRLIRLFPVSFLTVGFAATWWPSISSGPVWPITVEAESDICKEKFWSHLLFLNNLLEPEKLCVMPTWSLAVDIQMHIVATFLMVFLLYLSKGTLVILGTLFVGCCFLNAGLAYVFDWVPMLYLTVSPENLRTLFRSLPSFAGLYISPWGSLPACFLGLLLGYLIYGYKDQHFNMGKYKLLPLYIVVLSFLMSAPSADFRTLPTFAIFDWLLYTACVISLPLIMGYFLLGYFIQHVKVKLFIVLYAAFERSIFQILMLVSYIVLCVVCGFVIKFLAWRGWVAMSRLSLPVMMTHWMVNMYLVGSTPQPISTSVMDIVIYGVTTTVYTYLVAIPITLLVEMPMKKSFDIFVNQLAYKCL